MLLFCKIIIEIDFRNQIINFILFREIVVLNKNRIKQSLDQIFAIFFSKIDIKILLYFLCKTTRVIVIVQTKFAYITIVISRNISFLIVFFLKRKIRKSIQ